MAPCPRSDGPPGPRALLLLPLLCWAVASRSTATTALEPPRITTLQMPAEHPRLGCGVKISCEAVSSLPDLTLLYWLGNGSFIEKLHPDGAVHEGMLLEEPRGSGVVLRRDLLFSSFSARDLRTNFTCVVLSPVGLDTREVRWGPLEPAPTESRGPG
ncbi:interleukin-18-binding protein-like isoform X2 [Cygnus olor]|uniref:interleukin-18-binding protein-like isoform X2 n=1 Tax=Cygnus olor TaxID=8869 RepID=UPI001ADE90E9|nr:interleukin-18-binding protein-like isoform X2 [Cygnus olor]